MLLDLLSDALKAYKVDRTKDHKDKLRMSLQLLGLRLATENESTDTVIKDVKEFTGLVDRLRGKTN